MLTLRLYIVYGIYFISDLRICYREKITLFEILQEGLSGTKMKTYCNESNTVLHGEFGFLGTKSHSSLVFAIFAIFSPILVFSKGFTSRFPPLVYLLKNCQNSETRKSATKSMFST